MTDPHDPLKSLLDSRLVLVTGKGGTGKTTFAAALGLLAAARGKRVLVAEIDSHRPAFTPIFGREPGFHFEGILKAILDGHIKARFVLDDNIATDPTIAQTLHKLEFLVVMSSFESETTRIADIVLPTSTFAEKNGTFTNYQGRVQRIRPSVATFDQDRSLDGFAMSRLDRFGSPFDRWAKGVKRDCRPIWRIVAGIAAVMGVKYKYNTSEDVINEIVNVNPAFKGLSYRKIGNRGMKLKATRTPRPYPPNHLLSKKLPRDLRKEKQW